MDDRFGNNGETHLIFTHVTYNEVLNNYFFVVFPNIKSYLRELLKNTAEGLLDIMVYPTTFTDTTVKKIKAGTNVIFL